MGRIKRALSQLLALGILLGCASCGGAVDDETLAADVSGGTSC